MFVSKASRVAAAATRVIPPSKGSPRPDFVGPRDDRRFVGEGILQLLPDYQRGAYLAKVTREKLGYLRKVTDPVA